MPHPLDYANLRKATPDPVRPGRLTWTLSAVTVALWLASMFTWVVGDFESAHPSAMKIPGLIVACVMLPWWPVNGAMALMPLVVRGVARRGVDATDSLLRAAVLSFAATLVLFVILALMSRMNLSGFGLGIPLWLAAYVVGLGTSWRLARHDPWAE